MFHIQSHYLQTYIYGLGVNFGKPFTPLWSIYWDIYIYYRLLSLDTLVGKLRPLRAPLSILIDGPFDHFRLRG